MAETELVRQEFVDDDGTVVYDVESRGDCPYCTCGEWTLRGFGQITRQPWQTLEQWQVSKARLDAKVFEALGEVTL